jgi:hypothetical protein
MVRAFLICTVLLLGLQRAIAEEPAEESATEAEATEASKAAEEQGDGFEKPKTLSGMSILGNEEAPKSLVIIPWKSSELGDDISLSDTLDDRARPVDKDVFLRELSYYEIRSGK